MHFSFLLCLAHLIRVHATFQNAKDHDIKSKGKVVPVLNQAPRHEDVLGSGGIAPRVLDLGTRWR
jgi:hypothetical protein